MDGDHPKTEARSSSFVRDTRDGAVPACTNASRHERHHMVPALIQAPRNTTRALALDRTTGHFRPGETRETRHDEARVEIGIGPTRGLRSPDRVMRPPPDMRRQMTSQYRGAGRGFDGHTA